MRRLKAEVGPLVTVFTPAYNHAHYLDEYFGGLLAQTYTNVELIIFDDGSTDGTWAKIKEYEPRVRQKFTDVILERHQNIGPERETLMAFGRARGELICQLESDDYYLPPKLERNVAYLDAHPDVGVVHSDADWIFGDRIEHAHWRRTGRSIPTGEVCEALLFDNFVLLCSSLCRTQLVREYVDFERYMARGYAAPDYAMCVDLARGTRFGYIDESLVRYRVAGGSYSHPQDPERLYAFQRSIYAMKHDFVRENPVSSQARELVELQYHAYLYRGGFRACQAGDSEQGYAWLRARYPEEHRGVTHRVRRAVLRRPRVCRAVQRARRVGIRAVARATGRSPAVLESARANLAALTAGESASKRRRAMLGRSRRFVARRQGSSLAGPGKAQK